MAQQDDLIGLIRDVASAPPKPMQGTAYGNPTSEAIAAGYGGGPNDNLAAPDKIGSTDDLGRPQSRTFFQALPYEVRHATDPADPGGGLDVMSVTFLGGPEGGTAPVSSFKWAVKGQVVS